MCYNEGVKNFLRGIIMEKQFFQKTFSSLTEKLKKIAGKGNVENETDSLYADSSEQDFPEAVPPTPKPMAKAEARSVFLMYPSRS